MRKIVYSIFLVFILCGCQEENRVYVDNISSVDVFEKREIEENVTDNRIILFEDDSSDLILCAGNDDDTIINILYDDEVIQIEADYQNMYQENPNAILVDVDNDGDDEIAVVNRKYTGTITAYDLYIVDRQDVWTVFSILDINDAASKNVEYKYDEADGTITFSSDKDYVKVILSEWSIDYPFEGIVEFDKRYRYNFDTMMLEVVPYICMKDSLPVTDLSIFYRIELYDGEIVFDFDHFALHESETDFWYE